MTVNRCHAVRYCHGCKATTVTESITANRCHAVPYCHGCQATTAIENSFADRCHAVRYCHGCQATTAIESRIADTCHFSCPVHISNCLWYNYLARIRTVTTISICNLQFRTIIIVIVINGLAIGIFDCNVVGISLCSCTAKKHCEDNV